MGHGEYDAGVNGLKRLPAKEDLMMVSKIEAIVHIYVNVI